MGLARDVGRVWQQQYEWKTYRGLFLLLDFTKDPVVAARSRMLMDLAMVEIEQISLSGLRGGSKILRKTAGLTDVSIGILA